MLEVNGVKTIWCKVLLNDGFVYVGAIYRPPKAVETYPSPLLDYVNSHMLGGRIIMAGDFSLTNVN